MPVLRSVCSRCFVSTVSRGVQTQRLSRLTFAKNAPRQHLSLRLRRRGLAQASVIEGETEVKERTTLDVFANDSRPVILFDGVCNFCNAGVNLVLSLDQREVFRFAALQSDVGKALLQRCNRQPDDISSMVVVEKNAFYLRSDAALKIGERLQTPFPILSALLWPLPKSIRDNGYDWIAENRYKIFGMRDECRLTDKAAAERFLS